MNRNLRSKDSLYRLVVNLLLGTTAGRAYIDIVVNFINTYLHNHSVLPTYDIVLDKIYIIVPQNLSEDIHSSVDELGINSLAEDIVDDQVEDYIKKLLSEEEVTEASRRPRLITTPIPHFDIAHWEQLIDDGFIIEEDLIKAYLWHLEDIRNEEGALSKAEYRNLDKETQLLLAKERMPLGYRHAMIDLVEDEYNKEKQRWQIKN